MTSTFLLTSVRISPFCELARWALDRAGILYRESCHAPILNIPFTMLAGGGANVPVIQAPDTILDARQLLAYLDARARPDERLYPADPRKRHEMDLLVRSLIEELAIDVRLYAYAHMLPKRSVIIPLMTSGAPLWQRVLIQIFFPLQVWLMRRALGINPASTEKARAKILASFEAFSLPVQNGQRYLAGDQFSAADLVFAAVTAPIVLPPEYGAPLPAISEVPEPMQDTVQAVQSTPAGRLALRIYRDHRTPACKAADVSPSAGNRWSDSFRQSLTRLIAGPSLLRPLFALLRLLRPVWSLGKQAFITRHSDVIECLTRDKDFTIAELNAGRMNRISGPFILGMDASPDYDREAAAIRGVVKPGDLDWIRQIVRQAASQMIEAARPSGRLDIAGNYSRVAATRVVADYFGVPGPSERILMHWMRSLFWDVFLNRDDQPLVRAAADRSARQLREYLTSLIAEKSRETGNDDLLGRLVRSGALDADGVRRNITGIIVGAIDTTVTATVNAFDVLLSDPAALAQTRLAAQTGQATQLRQCCYEALRFKPQTPALLRHSRAEITLSSGARVPAGFTVLPLTLSAMFDKQAFPDPGRFLADRPIENYLHFGYGMHTCYGMMINGVQIPELIAPLVTLPGLRRASGRFGRTLHEGPFPDRLVVEFGA
jgi:cytochrome P450/glutathione S-transferase